MLLKDGREVVSNVIFFFSIFAKISETVFNFFPSITWTYREMLRSTLRCEVGLSNMVVEKGGYEEMSFLNFPVPAGKLWKLLQIRARTPLGGGGLRRGGGVFVFNFEYPLDMVNSKN